MTREADSQKRKVFIVDDHPMVREWLTNLIHQQADLVVCGDSEDAPNASQKIAAAKPDVAIVDIALKNSSGIELIKELKRTCPGLPVLVLSMHEETHYAERAMRAGAMGYIMKSEAAVKVIEGIRSLNAGQVFVSKKVGALMAQKLLSGKAGKTPYAIGQLSDRELEVFQLLGAGQNTKQISDRLQVGMKTVQTYCARIKEKLNLDNATELLREAIYWHDDQ